MSTYSAKPEDITHAWWIIDAKDLVTGRLAAKVATLLRGKHKPMFTPSMDCGDNVVIINAGQVKFKGKKMTDKIYYRHTGFPGGIRSRTLAEVMERKPTEALKKAVFGMLPKNKLRKQRIKNLHIYAGSEHPHEAQLK